MRWHAEQQVEMNSEKHFLSWHTFAIACYLHPLEILLLKMPASSLLL